MTKLLRVQGHIVRFLVLKSKWTLVILRCCSFNLKKDVLTAFSKLREYLYSATHNISFM